jgi:hypothetical protein
MGRGELVCLQASVEDCHVAVSPLSSSILKGNECFFEAEDGYALLRYLRLCLTWLMA